MDLPVHFQSETRKTWGVRNPHLNFGLEDQMSIAIVSETEDSSKLVCGEVSNVSNLQLWRLECASTTGEKSYAEGIDLGSHL